MSNELKARMLVVVGEYDEEELKSMIRFMNKSCNFNFDIMPMTFEEHDLTREHGTLKDWGNSQMGDKK